MTADEFARYKALHGEWRNAYAAGNTAEMRRIEKKLAAFTAGGSR